MKGWIHVTMAGARLASIQVSQIVAVLPIQRDDYPEARTEIYTPYGNFRVTDAPEYVEGLIKHCNDKE